MTFSRNNLDRSSSPYLRDHAENPVWWQEWNEATLAHAREQGRILFVSVGYSTCHWCHVMAREAFSDEQCADLLNRHFVSIKVDREQRPDIDHYMMSFLVATTGSGGWPLNVFLTPDARPFFAMTYASTEPRFNLPAFDSILKQVVDFYREKHDRVSRFELNADHSRIDDATLELLRRSTGADRGDPSDDAPVAMISDSDEQDALQRIHELEGTFDRVHAGFGTNSKFPPHASLLFLQYAHAAGLSDRAGDMVKQTLDAMMTRGLHDHLQGGFYRYTVDREWTIPHFEKMLYDQAMLLWNYSFAARLFDRSDYRRTAAGIVRALEETFRVEAGYASGHDADTDHEEGATYVWRLEEIEDLLTEEELEAAMKVFSLTREGNFDRRNHLVRISPPGGSRDESGAAPRSPAEDLVGRVFETMLAARRRRPQPFRDDKVILGWNALAGCALLAAHRYAQLPGTLDRAAELAAFLVTRFVGTRQVSHASLGSQLQEQEFLEDVGALLLFLTMLAEEGDAYDDGYADTRAFLQARLATLQIDGVWMESITSDFVPVPADPFDQPVPSGISLAQHALLLRQIRMHEEYEPRPYADAHGRAFANVSALLSRGYAYVVQAPEPLDWSVIPVNSVQIRGEGRTSCYRGVCYLGLPPGSSSRPDGGVSGKK